MNVIETKLPDVLLIELAVYGDARGFFMETYQQKRYREAGIGGFFVQDNIFFLRKVSFAVFISRTLKYRENLCRCSRERYLM